MTFGKRLKNLRLELELTQGEFAKKINSKIKNVKLWEPSGKQKPFALLVYLILNFAFIILHSAGVRIPFHKSRITS